MTRAEQTPPPPVALPVPELIQGAWTNLIVLTYSAHLGFFETHLLRQLGRVPNRLILADDRRLTEQYTTAAQTGQRLPQANRTYLAAPVRNPNAAHAKAVLLTTATEGRLLVGSGNLGQDGYAQPGELWHVYTYRETAPQHIDTFAAIRSLLDGLAEREWLDPPAVSLLHQAWSATPWLPHRPTGEQPLRHNLDVPLLDALTAAVTWPVDVLTVHAPFYDADAATLTRLLDALRPRQLRVLLSPDTSVDAAALMTAVTRPDLQASLLHATVTTTPATFLHAKLVHAAGTQHEVLLTGSANLSRRAMLLPANTGNVELAVLETRPHGGFDALYAPLTLTPVVDAATLNVAYRSDHDSQPEHCPAGLLYSEIRRFRLILTFNRVVEASDLQQMRLTFADGTPLIARAGEAIGPQAHLTLAAGDLERLTGGGRLDVHPPWQADSDPIPTWPYHTDALTHRLQRAAENNLLARTGALPDTDTELFDLLRQLEQTLIFDPATAWTVAGAADPTPSDAGALAGPALRWEDLDWQRLRRHPRYAGYFHGGRSSVAPTDIQTILASISAHLADLDGGEAADDNEREHAGQEEAALGAESAQSAADADARDDADGQPPPDEDNTRRLSASARNRRAFTRFVRRYAAAVPDAAFQEQLGATLSVHNAAIFNHLLRRLLQRHLVDAGQAIEAQLATWALLWGTQSDSGLLAALSGEEHDAAHQVLEDTGTRRTALMALSEIAGYDIDETLAAAVRDQAQAMIADPAFNLDRPLLALAAPGRQQASALLSNLRWLTSHYTVQEVIQEVVSPWGLRAEATSWRPMKVTRPAARGRPAYEQVLPVLEVLRPVAGLTASQARDGLARLAARWRIAGKVFDYLRIRFATGSDVAFWDATAGFGISLIDAEEIEFHQLEAVLPPWCRLLDDLESRPSFHSVA